MICSTPTENKGYSSLSDLLTSERLVEKIKGTPHNIYLIWFNYLCLDRIYKTYFLLSLFSISCKPSIVYLFHSVSFMYLALIVFHVVFCIDYTSCIIRVVYTPFILYRLYPYFLYFLYRVLVIHPVSLFPVSCFCIFFILYPVCCFFIFISCVLYLSIQVIQYYLSLSSDSHAEAWTGVLLLLFSQLSR